MKLLLGIAYLIVMVALGVAIPAYVLVYLRLVEIEWTWVVVVLTFTYFLAASITTLDARLIQAKRDGSLPPNEPMLPSWTAIFIYMQWGIFLGLLYINWKYALLLFVVKFVLKVLPVLETIGNMLMAPLKWRKR
jgi:hypothetical protein